MFAIKKLFQPSCVPPLLLAALISAAPGHLTADQADSAYSCTPKTFSSTVTWYDNSTLGLSACHYSDPTLPGGTTEATQFYAAAATHLYDDAICGACALITDSANGKSVTVMVTDECPAATNVQWCSAGSNHLDLSQHAFTQMEAASVGDFNVTWHVVPCPLSFLNVKGQNGANLTYQFKSGASSGWATLIIRDYIMPIKTVEYCNGSGSGCSAATWTRSYNGWVPPSGTWNTFYLRITDKGGNQKNFGPLSCCSPAGTDSKTETNSVYGNLTGGQMPGCVSGTNTYTSTITPTDTLTRTPLPTSTRTITPLPTSSYSSTPTSSSSPTRTSTPANTSTGTNTPQSSPSSTPTRSATPTSSMTPASTGTDTITATDTSSATPAASSTSSSTASPTRTATLLSTSTGTDTPGPSSTSSSTASPTRTVTLISTSTGTVTPGPSSTGSSTRTITAISTSTGTVTPGPSSTCSSTRTITAISTSTDTVTPGPSSTCSSTPTPTRTITAISTGTNTVTPGPSSTTTNTPKPSPTASATPTRTGSPTSGATSTATLPTATASPTPSATAEPSVTAQAAGRPGALAILKVVAAPNPLRGSSGSLYVDLQGEADSFDLRIYTRAMVEAYGTLHFSGRGPGWSSLSLPAGFTSQAPTGTYFLVLTGTRNGQNVKAPSAIKLVILR
jgi:expansin (peptidoglycan-binding protein)